MKMSMIPRSLAGFISGKAKARCIDSCRDEIVVQGSKDAKCFSSLRPNFHRMWMEFRVYILVARRKCHGRKSMPRSSAADGTVADRQTRR